MAIRRLTPADSQLIVFGGGWNPRVLYYAQRRCLIAIEPSVTDTYALNYATRHDVTSVVATTRGQSEARVKRLWPDAQIVPQTPGFLLLALSTPRG